MIPMQLNHLNPILFITLNFVTSSYTSYVKMLPPLAPFAYWSYVYNSLARSHFQPWTHVVNASLTPFHKFKPSPHQTLNHPWMFKLPCQMFVHLPPLQNLEIWTSILFKIPPPWQCKWKMDTHPPFHPCEFKIIKTSIYWIFLALKHFYNCLWPTCNPQIRSFWIKKIVDTTHTYLINICVLL
jgi:hypothetical protein